MKINGKVALVTGGARGMGRAIVLRFIHEGARVAFCDIRSKEGNNVVAEAKKAGGDCTFIKADITDREQVVKMAKEVEEKYGRIDILVNNAGWSREQLFVDTDESDWRWIEYDPVYERMWKDATRAVDRKTQEERIRETARYLYDHAYALFIYSPLTLYAVNKEVDFVPQKFYYLRLKETSVSENHWSVRLRND